MVSFQDNTTCLQDEYIAHRLGMIPVKVLNADYKGGDCSEFFSSKIDCNCSNMCQKCAVVFTLDINYDRVNAKRPADERDGPLIVTSADLKSSDER